MRDMAEDRRHSSEALSHHLGQHRSPPAASDSSATPSGRLLSPGRPVAVTPDPHLLHHPVPHSHGITRSHEISTGGGRRAVHVGSEVTLWDEGLTLAEAQERSLWHEAIGR